MTAPEITAKPLPPELDAFGFVEPRSDGGFDFAELGDGMPALLLQAYGVDGELLDTVAWAWGAASPWWLRHRAISYLGEAAIALHHMSGREHPVRLVPTPRDWLADGGRAVCIVDWRAPIVPLLEDLAATIACSSRALELKLRSAIERETSRRFSIRAPSQ